MAERGLLWTGTAWNSFSVTFLVAVFSAPPTAAIGILTAYLLTRHKFKGKNAFEFGTMLSFAIPGTIIGVSYVFAFNVPPIEMTSTGLILVVSFVFRNMPVGVRAGIAAMNQLDPHLDEASTTLNASSFQTFKNIINLINENAPVKIIAKNKNEEDIVTIFNEIIDEINKIDLRTRIESLEDKISLNLDEKFYSELLSLRSQLKGG